MRSRRRQEADQVHGAGQPPLPHVSGYVCWSWNARGGQAELVTPAGAGHRQEPTTPIRAGAAGPSMGAALKLQIEGSASFRSTRPPSFTSDPPANFPGMAPTARSAAALLRGFGVPVPRLQHSPCGRSAVGSVAIL